jgi:hypothetical protein
MIYEYILGYTWIKLYISAGQQCLRGEPVTVAVAVWAWQAQLVAETVHRAAETVRHARRLQPDSKYMVLYDSMYQYVRVC